MLWKVESGTGMGLRSSADVANCAFMHAVEMVGLGALCNATRQRYGIKHYIRDFDNLLFVCSPDFSRITALRDRLMHQLAPYTCTVEEASHIGVTFLDLSLVKDDHGRISFAPFVKPTCLRQVLSFSSHHHPSIHAAWMRSYMMNIRKHSSSLRSFAHAKGVILCRLRDAGVDHSFLDLLDRPLATHFLLTLPDV